MKKSVLAIGMLTLAIAMSQCKPAGDGEQNACQYAINQEAISVQWTAYKLTEKVGVSGSFKQLSMSAATEQGKLDQILPGVAFEIDSSSVDSGVPDRDQKIATQFFGTMQEAGKISGKVKSAADGTATVEVRLNGQTREVPMQYSVTPEDTLKASGTIDVKDFGAEASLAALNKVCEAQHTGPDKLSVLWPDVKLEIQAGLQKSCP